MYSLRKVKDYLQKKAKEAKKIELDQKRKDEQEAVKKMIEDDKKPKNKITNLFNPCLAVDPDLPSNAENEEAKQSFKKRIQELVRKENDPFKKWNDI